MPKALDKPIQWTEKQERALALTFEGRWTQSEIAEKCHIAPRTYRYWREHPDFQARLESLRADFAASIRDVTYADKARRIAALDQMAESARREYEQRPWLEEKRQIGYDQERDEPLYLINENFNRDAHAAFRDSLADIAAELGARKNVTEMNGTLDISGVVTFYLPQPESPPDEHTDITITLETDDNAPEANR